MSEPSQSYQWQAEFCWDAEHSDLKSGAWEFRSLTTDVDSFAAAANSLADAICPADGKTHYAYIRRKGKLQMVLFALVVTKQTAFFVSVVQVQT